MITNPDWPKPEENPYFHQTQLSSTHVSLYCIEKSAECMESIDIEDMDCDTCFNVQGMLSDEIDDTEFLEFAIDSFSEIMGYLAKGNLNIRIHRDITGLPPSPPERLCRAGERIHPGWR